MQMQEAAEASAHKMARRTLTRDDFEVYDLTSNSFFMVRREFREEDKGEQNWIADRKKGRGNRNSHDWTPLNEADDIIALKVNEWMAAQEGRGITIEKPWDAACMASPVNRAIRVKDKDGLLMIRLGDKRTFSEMLSASMVTPMEGPFKQYDGWEPMAADHFYATTDFLPYSMKFGDKGRLGKGAYVEPVRKPRKPEPENPTTKSRVETETIATAGVVSQSLATAIGSTKGDDQKRLVDALERLAKNVSWLMNENREEWQRKNNA